MSYILDALKKSEREKTLGQVPTLETVVSDTGHEHRARSQAWIVVPVLLVALAGLVFMYQSGTFNLLSLNPEDTPNPQDTAESNNAAPAVRPEPEKTAPADEVTAAGDQENTSQLPAKITQPASGQDNAPPLSAGRLAAPPAESVLQIPPQEAVGTTAPVAKNVSEPGDQPQPSQSPEPGQDSAEPGPQDPGTAAAGYDTVLPDALRNINVNVVTWSPQPRQRFTMLDLTIYKEGDTLPNGADIREIIQTGVIVDFQEQRYLLRP